MTDTTITTATQPTSLAIENLVTLENNEPMTTTLKVAEVFEKQHKHVLDKVRILLAENSADKCDGFIPHFVEKTYLDSHNRVQTYFEMNRDGFVDLVSNFTGEKARQWKRRYHAEFNRMEAYIRDQQKAKPMTTAEGFYAAAVILKDHESRLTTLEQRVDTIQQTVTKKHYSYPIAGEPKKVNGRIFRLASSYLKRKGYKNDQEGDDDAIRRYSREIYTRIKAMFRENYNINLDTERDQIVEDWNQRYLQGKINKDKTYYGKWTPDEIRKLSLVSEIAVSREWLSYFSEIMEELEAEEEGAVEAAAKVQQRIHHP